MILGPPPRLGFMPAAESAPAKCVGGRNGARGSGIRTGQEGFIAREASDGKPFSFAAHPQDACERRRQGRFAAYGLMVIGAELAAPSKMDVRPGTSSPRLFGAEASSILRDSQCLRR
jgi:hypothetical protein